MTKTQTLLICPNCGRESTDPKTRAVTQGTGAMTVYHCPCGNEYTETTARKVTVRDRT